MCIAHDSAYGLICNFVVDTRIVLGEAHLEPEVLRPSWQGSQILVDHVTRIADIAFGGAKADSSPEE